MAETPFEADLEPRMALPRMRINFPNGWCASFVLRQSDLSECRFAMASLAACPSGRWQDGLTELGESEAGATEFLKFLNDVAGRAATSPATTVTPDLIRGPASFAQVLAEIGTERERQITTEGYDTEHDDAHDNAELARAAGVLTIYAALSDVDRQLSEQIGPQLFGMQILWPWDEFKLSDRRRDLIKAGALIIAEIERLDRAELAGG